MMINIKTSLIIVVSALFLGSSTSHAMKKAWTDDSECRPKSSSLINLKQGDEMRHHKEKCEKATGVSILTSVEEITNANQDFGRLKRGQATGVVYPESTEQLEAIIHFANTHNLTVTLRSGGYSQGGQTLALEGGLLIDCSKLNRILKFNKANRTVKCEPGVKWGEVIEATSKESLAPFVMTFFPDLTIGGVLSVGGISGNSHKYGCASGNVEELEIITGTGQTIVCSRTKEQPLFEAALCGLGRCAAIKSATIRLRPIMQKVKTFYLLYTNPNDWINDQENIINSGSSDYLEAFCTPIPVGLYPDDLTWKPLQDWVYQLQVSYEFDTDEPSEGLIRPLKHAKLIKAGISETTSYLTRYGARARNMKATGNWNLAHPWWECFFPIETFGRILPELLSRLPLTLGDGLGYRIFSMNKNVPPSFMCHSIGFAVLPIGITPDTQESVLKALQEVNKFALANGGKRYLSGWFEEMNEEGWKQHYGEYYPTWKKNKETLDPNGTFESIFFYNK